MSALMSEFEAAWVREHAWTKRHRRQYASTPAYWHTCACQHGMTGHCSDGDHRLCGRGEPLPFCETYICDRADHVLHLATPFDHPSLSAVGWHWERTAMVWLGDRVCRWRCLCTCHDSPIPGRAVADVGEQMDLFNAGRGTT